MYQIIEFTHKLISEHVHPGDTVIDATCGNGNDTLFLTKLVGHKGKVYAFDIQEVAIANAQKLCNEHHNITFIHESHEHIKDHVQEPFKVVLFNLGYLPHGDKQITTISKTTMLAVQALLDDVITNDAMIALVIYPGHDEGLTESKAIEQFAYQLDKHQFLVIKYENFNRDKAPYLIAIFKNCKRD